MSRLSSILAVVILVALMLGCAPRQELPPPGGGWPMPGHDAARTSQSFYGGPTSKPSARKLIGARGFVSSGPVVAADGTIYLETGILVNDKETHTLLALEPDGRVKWRRRELYGPTVGPDGTVYVVGSALVPVSTHPRINMGTQRLPSSELHALTPAGAKKWTFRTAARLRPGPTVDRKGVIYCIDARGSLYAVSPAGKQLWRFAARRDLQAPAVARDGTVYVACVDGPLYAVDRHGTMKWRFLFKGDVFVSGPVVDAGGTCFVTTMRTFPEDAARMMDEPAIPRFYAIRADGKLKWMTCSSAQIVGRIEAVSADGLLYSQEDGAVIARDTSDGSKKWIRKVAGPNGNLSGPILDRNGVAYVAAGYEAAPMLSSITAIGSEGSVVWKITLPEGSPDSPVVGADHTIYLGTFSGGVSHVQDRLGLYAVSDR